MFRIRIKDSRVCKEAVDLIRIESVLALLCDFLEKNVEF
jgi:hypothetical protein